MAQITVDPNTMSECGENVLATMHEQFLVIVIDIAKTIGPSSTGKMMGIGSTGGFAALPKGLKGNVYVGKKA